MMRIPARFLSSTNRFVPPDAVNMVLASLVGLMTGIGVYVFRETVHQVTVLLQDELALERRRPAGGGG